MKKLIYLATTAMVLASCANDNAPLSMSSEQAYLGVSVNVATKSIVSSATLPANDKIAVFVAGVGYNPTAASEFTNSTTWTTTTPISLSNQVGKVYGFYPAGLTLSSLGDDAYVFTSLPAAESSFTGANQPDYMYATPTYKDGTTGVSNATGAQKVDLKFNHALAQISFVVNKATSYSGSGVLSKIRLVKPSSFNAGAGKMFVKSGVMSWSLGTVGEISFTGSANINSAADGTAITALGLVAPRTDNSGTTLYMTIDGTEMSVTLPTTGNATSWVAGSNYKYTITIGGTGLELSTVSVANWKLEDSGSASMN